MGGREGGRTSQTQTTLKGGIRFDFSNRGVEKGKNDEKRESKRKERKKRKDDISKRKKKGKSNERL